MVLRCKMCAVADRRLDHMRSCVPVGGGHQRHRQTSVRIATLSLVGCCIAEAFFFTSTITPDRETRISASSSLTFTSEHFRLSIWLLHCRQTRFQDWDRYCQYQDRRVPDRDEDWQLETKAKTKIKATNSIQSECSLHSFLCRLINWQVIWIVHQCNYSIVF